MEKLERLEPDEARRRLQELPGIGDYSADIINPHGLRRWEKRSWMAFFYAVQDLENLSRKLNSSSDANNTCYCQTCCNQFAR